MRLETYIMLSHMELLLTCEQVKELLGVSEQLIEEADDGERVDMVYTRDYLRYQLATYQKSNSIPVRLLFEQWAKLIGIL